MPKQILIAGGRNFKLTRDAFILLKELHERHKFVYGLSGMAKGVDSEAIIFYKEYNIKIKEFWPDWSRGKVGGYNRNLKMANELQTGDVGVIFAGGVGTNMMYDLLRNRPVSIIDYRSRMDLVK